jgi:hypothetical protein
MTLSSNVVGSQLVFVFDKDNQIRKKMFDYEDNLSSLFKTPFILLPVPDEADGNIPRFEGQSINGFSRIQVSQFRLSFITTYSAEFKSDLNNIKKYLHERLLVFKDIVTKLHEVKYVGYIFDVFIKYDESKINDFLKKYTKFEALKTDTIDFNVKYSFPYKANYFLNINVSKARQDELKIDNKGRIIGKTGKSIHGISVITDINSKRYIQTGNKFNFDLIFKMEKEIFEVISKNKIENYLTGDIK